MPTSTLSVTRMMIPGVVLLLAFFLVGGECLESSLP